MRNERRSTLRMLAASARSSPAGAARAALVGISAALRAPFWISGARLRRALDATVDGRAGARETDPALEAALRVANGSIRQLSRTRVVWRNTCLYRSAAQYLVLREFGRHAAIRIGVKNAGHQDDGDVAAHSWVVHDGPEVVQDAETGYEELAFTKHN